MLAEDRAYGNLVIYRFLKNGITGNQPCVVTTHGSKTRVMLEMNQFGIDVMSCKHRRLLEILQIRSPTKHPRGQQTGFDRIAEMLIGTGTTPPRRIAGRFVRDLRTAEGLNAQLEVEKMWESARAGKTEFCKELGHSLLLCPFFLSEINLRSRPDWLDACCEDPRCRH